MKKIILLLLTFFILGSVQAQIKMRPEMSIAYLQHSKLIGVSGGCSVVFPLKNSGNLSIGITAATAGGNRNVVFDPEENPNINFDDHVGTYWRGLLFPYTIEMKIHTSSTMQYTAQFAYSKDLKSLVVGAGLYATYINKYYLAGPIDDFTYSVQNTHITSDFYIPFHVRYVDFGPYFIASKRINKPDAKIPLHTEAKVYLATGWNWSYHLGMTVEL